MIQINPREPHHTHRLALGQFEAFCDPTSFPEISAQLVERAGGGVPHVEFADAQNVTCDPTASEPGYAVNADGTEHAPTEPAPKPVSEWGATVHDAEAETRINAQQAALREAGVNVDASQQFFATGTRMAAEGYASQAARKREHDAKTSLRDAAEALASRVQSEGRREIIVEAGELAGQVDVNGKIRLAGFALTEQALRGIAGRLESPMLGYALGLRERIETEYAKPEKERDVEAARADRAKIAQILAFELKRAPKIKLRLRVRANPGDVYAVVSPAYGLADAPSVVDQIASDLPSDAKGSWSYDPITTAWELRASIWTPTPVDQQAVGEPFEGYASYQSRDNGTGRFNGGGGVILIRCLNASTYTADDNAVSRTHRGRILYDIAAMTSKAIGAIGALCKAWGLQREAVVAVPDGVKLSDAIPGFWRGLLTARSGELARVLPGRTETHVKALTEAFHEERRVRDRLVRSDFAQGWTRYVQDQPTDVRRDAERAIGAWLVDNARPLRCELAEA